MDIGIPKEIKDHEYRVGLTPSGVAALVKEGHRVRVQQGAGEKIGLDDAAYRAAGAELTPDIDAVFDCALIVKVKEPQPSEVSRLRAGQTLFSYLHLAPEPALTEALLEKHVTAIAYETVTDAQGAMPLLIPMSEVAGRLAAQAGAHALQMANGGNGTLLGGVPGVAPGQVVVIGAGTVGTQAARMALGLGADVTLLDVNLPRLRQLDDLYGPRLKTRYSEPVALAELMAHADLVIGAVLLPGKRAPKLITRAMVRSMKPGAAFVDVAIDQGGCSETSRPTTHSAPTYIEEGVVHYCVTNMPAACARTSTQALTHATFPYVLKLARLGTIEALRGDAGLRNGLQAFRGALTYRDLADDLGKPWVSAETLLTAGSA